MNIFLSFQNGEERRDKMQTTSSPHKAPISMYFFVTYRLDCVQSYGNIHAQI